MPKVNRVHIPGTKLAFLWQRPKETHINITDYTLINAIRNLAMLNGFQINSGTPDFDFEPFGKGRDYIVEISYGVPRRLITPIGSYNLHLQIYGGSDAGKSGDVAGDIKKLFLGKEIPSSVDGVTLININPSADLSGLEHRLRHQPVGSPITMGNDLAIVFPRSSGNPAKALVQ
ncbi:MAG: hypothetical protein A3B68_09415 [Candidatus Melainabacteria bacterium RIFCSPHIGHO2_02_FULL_34_12]|nr:MAG: hypothetical protein A3B68_09415 [Candidatus Melainabacteria bacterium RIFCSPHIGHO2_02_FULL_34_12]